MEPEEEREGVDFWNVGVEQLPQPNKRPMQLPRSYADVVSGAPAYNTEKATLVSIFYYSHKRDGSELTAYFNRADGSQMQVLISEYPFGPKAFIAMWEQYFAYYPLPTGEPLKFSGMPIMIESFDKITYKSSYEITTHDVIMKVEFHTTNRVDLYLTYTFEDANTGDVINELHLEKCKRTDYPQKRETFEPNESLRVPRNFLYDDETEHLRNMKFNSGCILM